jgi:hypothetical protein
LGGAFGGAVGALFGGLVVGRLLPQGWRRGAVAVLGLVFGLVCSRLAVVQFATNELSPAAIEASLLDDPNSSAMARAWRDVDPESFRAFAETLMASVRDGASGEELVNASRAAIIAEAVPRILYLEDVQLVELASLSREQLRQFRQNRPEICRPYFVGEPFGDIRPYLTDEVMQRELALLEASFRADMTTQRRITAGSAFETTLAAVLASTRERVGDDVLMLTGEASAVGRDTQFCDAAVSFYDAVIALPQAEAAAFVRGLRSPG